MIELMDKIEWDAVGAAIVEFLENIDWDTLLSKWGTLMGQFIDAKLRAVDLSGALDVGMEIVAGLAKGMWNKFLESGGVLGWLKSLLVDPIINGVKSLLGIHSPSTVFAELGGFLIAGLAQGISDTWHTITVFFSEKISSLKQVLMDAWENIKSTASSKWSEIKAALGAKWDEIKSSASETFEKVRQKIVDAWNNVKNDAIEKWDEIKALPTPGKKSRRLPEKNSGKSRTRLSTQWTRSRIRIGSKPGKQLWMESCPAWRASGTA